uniref:Colipase N-terminal domain-containing protein n=1 Tax=Callorhinchus milii TaxID=7868 RepID=A0A4W3HAM5_CALMI
IKIVIISLSCWIINDIPFPRQCLILQLNNSHSCIESFQCKKDCCQRNAALSVSGCFS